MCHFVVLRVSDRHFKNWKDRLNEFLSDTQKIGLGVVVGQGNWEQIIENNKQAFTAEFVQRARFTTAFPASLTLGQFVDTLNNNGGSPLSQAERDQLVTDLTNGAKTRAQVLRAVAEDVDLLNAESNRAFVLMQYFGYLRRNPVARFLFALRAHCKRGRLRHVIRTVALQSPGVFFREYSC
jgi:hypothetical protein